jgi:hypothetical protein
MSNIRDTSLKALKDNKISLGQDQQEVFEAICDLGPTIDVRIFEYLQQKENLKTRDKRHTWRNSDVPARRNQLMKKMTGLGQGIVVDRGSYFGETLIRGRQTVKKYHFWSVWNDERPIPAGWYQREEDVPGYKPRRRRQLVGAGSFKATLF